VRDNSIEPHDRGARNAEKVAPIVHYNIRALDQLVSQIASVE